VRSWILLGAVVLSLGAGACGATASSLKPPSGPSITIGSADSAEQVMVANLYAAVLEHAGARVTLHTASRTDPGTRRRSNRL
jgi:glycine betaine/choline ABC-type transport system substrate-binding protein